MEPLIHLTEEELLDALIQAHAGIQPATVLAQLKHRHAHDEPTHTHPM